jgi:hypothetical protein
MTAPVTLAARTLSLYRARLKDLLDQVDNSDGREETNIRFSLGTLIEQLSTELMLLYHESARGGLVHSDQTIVLPALERMRDILRRAHRRPLPLRDALHKAITAMPSSPP